MATARPDRRLAAILAADVAGYSGLIEQDEAGTLARLTELRSAVVEPQLASHHGRLIKLMGDGFLAEFPSVVDAVVCAVAIQTHAMADLPLRIGLNLGDVVVEGADLYGDGVNIASRLEGLAEPGGIIVSGTAWDHLHGQLGLSFASLGEQQLKNIARPVRAYRLLRDPTPQPGAPPKNLERPSIAVLPFDNLSGDPAQAYFSDGITEDLITELSRFRDLVVLARHSSFALRGQGLGAAELGRRLGVSYLLEGSVRKAGERVRVTAQLIETARGAHLWADRYDRALDDIFAVQDEVVATIATTLASRIEAVGWEHAKRKPPADLAAYDCVLRGLERFAAQGPEANSAARSFFERAIALDPGYGLAHAYLALHIFNEDWGDQAMALRERCLQLTRRAVELDPADSRCHRILAMVLLSVGEFERAEYHAMRSVTLNPNDANAQAYRSYLLVFMGHPDEAVAAIERAIRLNPFHPNWYWNYLGRALVAAGRYEAATAAFERFDAPRLKHRVRLAACYAGVGRVEDARRAVAAVLAELPDFSSSTWVATLPYRHEADRRRLLDDLLAAGLPR